MKYCIAPFLLLGILTACDPSLMAPSQVIPSKKTSGAASQNTPTEKNASTQNSELSLVKPDTAAFEQRYQVDGKDPEKTVVIWFEALYKYLDKATQKEGEAQLDLLMAQSNWRMANSTATFRTRTQSKPYIFRSYAKGSAPENQYAMNSDAFELIFEREDQLSETSLKLFIKSSGADNPRALRLDRNKTTGLWQVAEFSSIYVDIRSPQS